MSESREAARERARELRAAQRKSDLRRRIIVTLSIVGVVLVAGAIVTLVLMNARGPASRGPLNMLSDGIKIGADFQAASTPALGVGQTPVASDPNPTDLVDIKIYFDYLCPNCGLFEERNGAQLREWIGNEAATVEYHPIAIFTSKSPTEYSLRAANAAACVAEFSPGSFFAFHESLFANQPEENTDGLSDDELVDLALDAGAGPRASLEKCVDDQRFRRWVKDGHHAGAHRPDRRHRGGCDRVDADDHRQRPRVRLHDGVRPERVRAVRRACRRAVVQRELDADADADPHAVEAP